MVLVLAWLTPGTASAAIVKSLNVNVYQLCNDDGSNAASLGPTGNVYFANEVNRIWSQAGISVNFNFVGQIKNTAFGYLDDSVAGDGFNDLYAAYGTGNWVVDMFLVHTVAGAYGEGCLGAGGLVIAMDSVMGYNSPLGRIDTIAHELGHNLGLDETPGGVSGHSTNPSDLMASGGVRLIPPTIADIYPDGLGYDRIPADQIAVALSSDLLSVVPEPSTYLAGLFMLAPFAAQALRRCARAGTPSTKKLMTWRIWNLA